MSLALKITRRLLDHTLADLNRPHKHAAERVGFLACRCVIGREGHILLCYEYIPVEDDHYMRDHTCSARIDGRAIRSAMERALMDRCALLHVHTHGDYGQPEPSLMDKADLPGIAESVFNVLPAAGHGWVVLSRGGIAGEILLASKKRAPIRDLSIIGNPMLIPKRPALRPSLWQRLRGIEEPTGRQSRQGFLGTEAGRVISNAKIGIIGLCGGGSHIVQQLAHIGVCRFVLCDDDVIENSNLNRLVGATVSDVKRCLRKTAIAKRVIRGLQPLNRIDDKPGKWQEKMEHLRDCDIIFGCLDSFLARRDLEGFCRRCFIPLIDIGMDVPSSGEHPEIYGQVVLSLPGCPCLHCMGVLSERTLSQEAQNYGNAGERPQVVWSNGVLASTAVGFCMELLTGWSRWACLPLRMDYKGSMGHISRSGFLDCIEDNCTHYPIHQAGEPILKTL